MDEKTKEIQSLLKEMHFLVGLAESYAMYISDPGEDLHRKAKAHQRESDSFELKEWENLPESAREEWRKEARTTGSGEGIPREVLQRIENPCYTQTVIAGRDGPTIKYAKDPFDFHSTLQRIYDVLARLQHVTGATLRVRAWFERMPPLFIQRTGFSIEGRVRDAKEE